MHENGIVAHIFNTYYEIESLRCLLMQEVRFGIYLCPLQGLLLLPNAKRLYNVYKNGRMIF